MGGVEIEFSIDSRESGTHEEEGGNETETGETQPQSNTAEARSTRIHGRPPPRERRSTLLRLRAVPTQLMQLLGHAGLRRIFANRSNGGSGITLQINEDELDDGFGILGSRRRRRARSTKDQIPAIPSEVGQKLMDGGVFGTSEYYRDNLRKRNRRLARKLMSRELGNDRNYSTRATSTVSQV